MTAASRRSAVRIRLAPCLGKPLELCGKRGDVVAGVGGVCSRRPSRPRVWTRHGRKRVVVRERWSDDALGSSQESQSVSGVVSIHSIIESGAPVESRPDWSRSPRGVAGRGRLIRAWPRGRLRAPRLVVGAPAGCATATAARSACPAPPPSASRLRPRCRTRAPRSRRRPASTHRARSRCPRAVCSQAAWPDSRCRCVGRELLELAVEDCPDNLGRGVRQERPLPCTGVQRKCLPDAEREPDGVLRFDLMDAHGAQTGADDKHRGLSGELGQLLEPRARSPPARRGRHVRGWARAPGRAGRALRHRRRTRRCAACGGTGRQCSTGCRLSWQARRRGPGRPRSRPATVTGRARARPLPPSPEKISQPLRMQSYRRVRLSVASIETALEEDP